MKKKWVFLTGLLVLNIGLIFYILKKDTSKAISHQNDKEFEEGKNLAEKYCQSCHLLPSPSSLPKEMWETGVMPTMGPFFGYNSFDGKLYNKAPDADHSYFPSEPIIDSVKWQKIVNYYLTAAPDYLPPQNKSVDKVKELTLFDILLPKEKSLYGKVAMTSYVKIDTSVKPHRLLVNDPMSQQFYVLDQNLNLTAKYNTQGPIVDLVFNNDQILACYLGNNVEANNLRNGKVAAITINNNKVIPNQTPLFDKLARPVKITKADLNNDGKTDYVLSQFGNLVGNLSWMENLGSQKFKPQILRNKPGVLTTIINDYNNDGKQDIWALFAQGDEGIFLYTNTGNGKMQENQILRFPPSYGSTSFDLVDFNKDGHQDIIYTCGDNADFTPVLKPYHGVYIFLNNGENSFKQRYFYPINGCYKAVAKDFDRDGEIDIAAISFFPSSLQPEEAFTYLKNNGNYNFSPYKLPLETPFQKGITMDVADFDQDGKLDILLGNGYYSSDEANTHIEPLFIVLKNKTP